MLKVWILTMTGCWAELQLGLKNDSTREDFALKRQPIKEDYKSIGGYHELDN